MRDPLFTTSVAIALLSLVDVATAEPKVVRFDFQRRAQDDGPLSAALARRSSDLTEALTWGNLLYYINITLGTPGQSAAVWLDTGSSDLWVPDTSSGICQKNSQGCSNLGGFYPSHSSSYKVLKADAFEIAYASGDKIQGDYGQDTLAISGAKVTDMIFGLASKGSTTTPLSGIMGIGYPLGESLVTNDNSQPYPNVILQLLQQGFINSATYSLYLNDLTNGHGSILFGGVDTAKYTGELGIVDVQVNAQTGHYDTFTVVLSALSFTASGGTSNIDIGGGLAVILDSGTTLTYFPNDIAQSIYNGLGIVNDPDLGPYLPCNVDTSNLKFTFTFGGSSGVPIDVDLGQFIMPYDAREQLPLQAGGGNSCSFGLLGTGQVANGGGDILFGDTFLRSAYVVYDLANNQIGLAQTKFDVTDTNIKDIGVASVSTNTIPGATTVQNMASLSQSNTAFAFPTYGFGAATTTVNPSMVVSSASATFKGLSGGLKTGATSAGGSKSAAPALRVPPVDFASLIAIGVAGLTVLLGGSMLMLF